MKNKKTSLLSAAVAVIFALAFFAVGFQKTGAVAPIQLQKTDAFKNYKFGSVDVQLSGDVSQPVAGSLVRMKAEISNNNEYPVVQGNLFIKLFKKQNAVINSNANYFKEPPPADFIANGDFLVDQWIAQEGINLGANETKTISFEYKISTYAEPGKYHFTPYFQVEKKWNLLGLPFTEDIAGASLNSVVTNKGTSSGVEFQKNNVRLQGEAHNFIGFIKSFDSGQKVEIIAPLKNSNPQSRRAKVTWEVYYWDNLLSAKPLEKKEEFVNLEANEGKNLLFSVAANSAPVNYVVATADYQGTKSVLNIRFGRRTEARARINFAGIQKFPGSGENKIFATAHLVTQPSFFPNSLPKETEESQKALAEEQAEKLEERINKGTEWDKKVKALLSNPPRMIGGEIDKEALDREMAQLQAASPYGKASGDNLGGSGGNPELPQGPVYKIALDILDENKREIQTFEYSGTLTGEVMGFEAPFALPSAHPKIYLAAKVFDSRNELQDETLITYDCSQIDSEQCAALAGTEISSTITKTSGKILWSLILASLLLAAGALVVSYLRKKRKEQIVFPDRNDEKKL